MSVQNELTLVTPVKEGDEDTLSRLLLQLKSDLEKDKKEPFENLNNIHFARWIFSDKKETDQSFENILSSRLIFASVFDGPREEHYNALSDIRFLGTFTDQLYEHCIDYPRPGERTTESRKAYLKRWRAKPSAFYVGAPGRSLTDIRQESELRNAIRSFLSTGNWKNKSASDIHKAVQQYIFSNHDFAWAKQHNIIPGVSWPGMVLLGVILLVLSPVIILWVLIVHFFYEVNDNPEPLMPSQVKEEHMRSLEEYEDLEYQNQFTQLLVMKPGRVRLLTVQAFLLFAKGLIKFLFVQGKLMGIPTIHFARWTMLDDGKHMLFFSNFDGSWQQYLGDFIDKSGWGLTGIWSNTVNFPKTHFLFTGGAYDEEHFLAWSRRYEIPTQVWYSAYPHLSIKNIINNTFIRNELSKNLTEKEAAQFLKRF